MRAAHAKLAGACALGSAGSHTSRHKKQHGAKHSQHRALALRKPAWPVPSRREAVRRARSRAVACALQTARRCGARSTDRISRSARGVQQLPSRRQLPVQGSPRHPRRTLSACCRTGADGPLLSCARESGSTVRHRRRIYTINPTDALHCCDRAPCFVTAQPAVELPALASGTALRDGARAPRAELQGLPREAKVPTRGREHGARAFGRWCGAA